MVEEAPPATALIDLEPLTPALEVDRWYVLFVLTLVYTVNIADRYVASTLITPIKAEFHLSDSAVGLLTGAGLVIFYVVAGIPLGWLADRTNRKGMIAVALTIWSLLTALCGATHNFWQLLAVRMSIGVAEAGGIPPSQSLLSDKFPPAGRPFAMSLFSIGAAAGAALGASLGGHLSESYGWRSVLVVFGAIGIPVALLLMATMREPARGRLDCGAPKQPASLSASIIFVARQRSLLYLFAGGIVLTYWSWGLVWWTPAFLLRSHDITLSDSGRALGLMHGAGGVAVTLFTAWTMKRLENKDPTAQIKFIVWTTVAATFPSIIAYSVGSPRSTITALWLFVPMIYIYIGPSLALVQNLAPAAMRAQVCALFLFAVNISNLLIAPMLIGALSDLFSKYIDRPYESLRYVLIGSAFTGFGAAWLYNATCRYLVADLERAGTAKAPG